MNELAEPVTITLRIPGQWSHPSELLERMPADCRLTPDALVLPDGTHVEIDFREADGQFAGVFRSACRRPAKPDELKIVDNYAVNVILHGPGGSLPAALSMMQAGAAIVRAGGAGVFIDNSALAHGGKLWLDMTEDGGPDALSFAFVAVIRGDTQVWTMGMHVLGLRDVLMKRADIEEGGFDIVEMIRYLCESEKPVDDGHVIADLDGPQFRTIAQDSDRESVASPMHNPFGRLKLVSLRDIADAN